MKLRHSPVIKVLASTKRVGEMHLPIIPVINIGKRCSYAAFSHYRMRFAEQRFANESNRNAIRCSLNGSP